MFVTSHFLKAAASILRGRHQGGCTVLLTNFPAPYRITQFNWLAENCGGDFRVVFLALSERQRAWTIPVEKMKFKWSVLQEVPTSSRLINELWSGLGMLHTLLRWRPQAVICAGYDSVAGWIAFFLCKLFRRRFVLWSPSTSRDSRKPNKAKYWLKRLIVSGADGIASVGTASATYALQLGARPENIYFSWNAVDNHMFFCDASNVNASIEKQRYGYPQKLILYSGRLTRDKGVFVLLEAFAKIASKLTNVGLLLVGHGPDQNALGAFCHSRNLTRVFFSGPQSYDRLPYYYALADVLVLPTFSDTWGMVVNEAFAVGVPALVSQIAGCCEDLIVEGETGFAVRPGDSDGLAQKLLHMLSDDDLRSRMSTNCRQLISRYTQEACARGLLDAAMGTPGKSLASTQRISAPRMKRFSAHFG